MKRFKIVAACAALTVAQICSAQSVDVKLPDGGAIVTVIAPNVFRISAALDGVAVPIKSEFIAPSMREQQAQLIGKVVENEAIKSLVTEGGTFQIDTKAGTWWLVSAAGKQITPASAFVQRGENSRIELPIGWPQRDAADSFGFYGGGNVDTALIHSKVNSHVGNGVAVVPFAYSTAGFATFAVSEDDDKPMSTDGPRDGTMSWHAAGSHGDLYVIIAPNLDAAVSSYNKITGLPPVPPKWAFGYLQSRWGWQDKAYIDDTLKQFIDRKLPVDGFIFDFEWYTTFPDYGVKPAGHPGFSDFEFNPKLFPNPAEQIKTLHDAGIKVIGIRKPRLGNTDTLVMAREKDWVTHAGPREGFESRNIRFGNPALRTWYAKQTEPLLQAGIDAWWDDEGELTYTTYQHWNEAQIEGLKAVRPNARHWSIDRAFSPGLQRTGAAAWTGDIRADWKTLEKTPADLLNWSIGGMTYGSCDIGGFVPATNPQLLTRWMEAAVFFPVMRSHSTVDAKPHFPWLYGEESEAAMRKALNLRYQLVPMLYSLGHKAHETGVPIMRPLAAEFPNDPNFAQITSQWMVGDLMVAPILTESNHRAIYLPPGDWYDFATNEKTAGGKSLERDVPFDAIPVFAKAGSIVPLGPVVQRTRDCASQPLELRVYPGHDATFTVVEDDGETADYLDGKLRRILFTWNDAAKSLEWKTSGDFAANTFKSIKVAVAGLDASDEIPLKGSGRWSK